MSLVAEPTSRTEFSLDDLIALNDEIAALIRAGVPLEVGLDASFSRRLGGLTRRLQERIQQGRSLAEALAAEGEHLPRVYRAIVEAGLKSGRLPEALESLSVYARSLLELKRRMTLAFVYPSMVLIVAYGMFVAFIVAMVPRLDEVYRQLQLPTHSWLLLLRSLNETVHVWGPAILVVAIVLWLVRGGWLTGHAAPWMWSIVANFNRASFAGLLALLVEHRLPLPEALRLAGNATGGRRIRQTASDVAADVESGESLAASLTARRAFPPFMRWMIANGEQQGALGTTLRQTSEIYRRRALYRAEWFKTLMPVLLTAILGGGFVLVYGLTLFIPLTDLLRDLSQEF